MITNAALIGIMGATFAMVIAKRITALIRGFSLQSMGLFLFTLGLACSERNTELFVVAGLILIIKVILIPYFLKQVVVRIKAEEDLGLFVNPVVSLCWALGLTYLAYVFSSEIMSVHDQSASSAFAAALAVVLIGMFKMIFRAKALSQVIGLMVMENGLFLAAAAVSGGMPFFVEIAIFFDIFVCVLILGMFVYRINRLFTHIDVNKLRRLRG